MLCDIGGHVMDVRTVCAQLFEAVSIVFLLVGVLIAPSMALNLTRSIVKT